MIDQIIEFNIMSPLLGDGYKAGGIMVIAILSGLLSGLSTNAVFAFGEEIAWRGFLM